MKRMMTRALEALAIVVALGAATTFAQDRQPSDAAARAAARYGAESWPAADKSRDGVDPEAIAPAGLVRRALDVDAFRATARVTFGAKDEKSPNAVLLTVRVHPDASSARAALLETLASSSATLARSAELGLAAGDVAFAGADARGRVRFVAFVRANVSATIRAIAPASQDALDDDMKLPAPGTLSPAQLDAAVRATTTALDGAIAESPLLAPGAALSAPRVREIGATIPAKAEHGTPLKLDVDPAGPAAAHVAWEATNGASVLVANDGTAVLHAGKPGAVTVRVAVASNRLCARVVEAHVDVGAP